MDSSLSIDVFNSGYKPIPGGPGWDPGTPATWPASTSTLISGDRDAQLIASDQQVVDEARSHTTPEGLTNWNARPHTLHDHHRPQGSRRARR